LAVKGVAGICAGAWSTNNFRLAETHDAAQRQSLRAFTNPITGPLIVDNVIVPGLLSDTDQERSTRWHVASVVLGRSLLMNGRAEQNTDYSVFQDTLFVIAHASEDRLMEPGVKWLLKNVPGCVDMPFTGFHTEGVIKCGEPVLRRLLEN